MIKKPALGKGLSSLLPPSAQPTPPVALAVVTELPIDQIRTNPNQPRKEFKQEQLQELANSIQRDGIIQPLIVRKSGDHHELVAGERRYRAAKMAGLEKVPVVVQSIADDQLLEIALIENVQREDLNPIELAIAFERMSVELSLNHEEIGTRTGKDRATITNAIRLLQLPVALQDMISRRELTPGHARAILKLHSASEQRLLADRVIREGWSVRKTESYTPTSEAKPLKEKPPQELDPNVRAAVDRMESALGTKVRIVEKGTGHGQILIDFYSPDDLDRIYTLIASD